jgi:hypothetical protein
MKNIKLSLLFFCGFIISKSQNTFAQNLQFNQAVFNTYGPGNADGNAATPMFTGTLVVGANQILKITGVRCTSINTVISGSTIPNYGSLSINDHLLYGYNVNDELWLPSGSYVIKGLEYTPTNQTNGAYRGLITGILYDIVP